MCIVAASSGAPYQNVHTEPHPYYRETLLWDQGKISLISATIAEFIELEDLHVCSDGAYQQEFKQGEQAWVFSTSSKHILWKGAGPTLGHPDAMTPYRAELSVLTSCFYMLYWVCQSEKVNCGKVTIYCDNEAALNEVFATPRRTNNSYKHLQVDLDLL
jgi:hypothetical protein